MAEPTSGAAAAFARQAWGETCGLLNEVGLEDLDPGDLDRLAVASYLIGADDAAVAAWEKAHERYLAADERAEAARCSFWAAFCLMMRGQMAHAGGWLNRTERIIGDDLDCPTVGYLLVPALLQALDADDAAAARSLAIRAGEIAARFSDRDLAALSTLGHGQALLAMGEETAGLALLDDVMLSVSSGEVGPIITGVVYCAVILECMQLLDLARATEWTAALDAWCAAQPDLVPYRGQCLVHQSQLQQAAGEWSDAASTATLACERLADPPHPALGLAWYQEGELSRLQGHLDAAAAAYRRASESGYHPMPGLALLELARGDVEAAAASIRRSLAETHQPFQRPGLLSASVEILLAADDLAAAAAASGELAAIATQSSSHAVRAMAEQATGMGLLAAGDPAEAMPHLRAARQLWQRLQMPYEAARVSLQLGQGCLALGDTASAALELASARDAFGSLGAQSDVERAQALSGEGADAGPDGLSARELQVLAEVAEGKTNREVADALSISRHTVGRHLENIFVKLGVSSRAAATAAAYRRGLL